MTDPGGVEPSEEVRRKAETLGEPGRAWLADLGGVVAHLERSWGVVVGGVLGGGSDGFAAAATTGDGRPVVLKVALPIEGPARQIETLVRADGHGYVRVLRYDLARRAMLLERLGPSLAELGWPVDRQLEVMCSTLRTAWEVDPDPTLPSGADKAAWLGEFVTDTWEEFGRPCDQEVIDRAVTFSEARAAAFDPVRAVLVHGDVHSANTLLVDNRPEPSSITAECKLIDPDGLFAEPACDLGVLMREHSRELLDADDTPAAARRRCAQLARLTGADEAAIWEWGFVECVSTGLLALRVGRANLGRDLLAVANSLVNG